MATASCTASDLLPALVPTDAAPPPEAGAAAEASLVRDQRGALTFVEWLILFAVVVVIIALAANVFANQVEAKYDETGQTIEGLDVTIPYTP